MHYSGQIGIQVRTNRIFVKNHFLSEITKTSAFFEIWKNKKKIKNCKFHLKMTMYLFFLFFSDFVKLTSDFP